MAKVKRSRGRPKGSKSRTTKQQEQMIADGMTGKVLNVEKKVKPQKGPQYEHRFHVWLSNEQYEWVSLKAFRAGKRKSEYIRLILDAVRLAEQQPNMAAMMAKQAEEKRNGGETIEQEQ